MLQSQGCDGFSYAARLIKIERLRTALGDGAETAAAGADVAEQHEGGGLVVPAFADVRALGGFANRVQSEATCQLFELVKVLTSRGFGPQPGRLGLPHRRAQFNLYQL